MRGVKPMRNTMIVACAAILAGLTASPAAGVTNLYAPQGSGGSAVGGVLSQFSVAPDGSLTPLADAALGSGAQDIAITPDGRFAYVTRNLAIAPGQIAQFARAQDGSMAPNGSIVSGTSRGILVNPQGTYVYSANTFVGNLDTRPIQSDGRLGASTTLPLGGPSPRFLAMAPSGTSLYVAAFQVSAIPVILQFDVDPATGVATPKATPSVSWPSQVGPSVPTDIARMTVSPDGGHLYAASGEGNTGIAHFAIDATGALVGGALVGIPGDGNGISVAPISPGGLFLWGPTSALLPGHVDQFAIAATGALSPLAAAVPYIAGAGVDGPARDAVASPGGRTLYLGQDENVGEWAIAPGGTLTVRANHPLPTGTTTNAGIVLSPSQSPVASFTVAPATAGQATTFDARASSDPDGTIARFDWDFGDGTPQLADGGPTPSHVYATAGARTATLVVTDADGTSTSRLWTGSRMLRNGGSLAQTTRAFAVPAPPVPPLVAPPPPPPPSPDEGVSVTIVATQGTVRVRVPGSSLFVDVAVLREIPLGSRIDARKGRVRVTAEVDARTHSTQSSLFYDGMFVVAQTKGSTPVLEARMVGGTFAGCAAASARGLTTVRGALAEPLRFAAAKTRSKRRVRRLWGRGEGNFRTRGRHSSATVRGTWWLVEDRCDGTLTRVKQGRVDVRDIRLKKTIRLQAGKRFQYLAKAP